MLVKLCLVILLSVLIIKSEYTSSEENSIQTYIRCFTVNDTNSHFQDDSFPESELAIDIVETNINTSFDEDNRCQSMTHIYASVANDILEKDSVANLPNLEKIHLDDVYKINPGAFRNLPKLRYIEISASLHGLPQIRKGVFNYLLVEYLILRGNNIEAIEQEAFDNMTNLKKIDLSGNSLSKWNNWFFNTPHLVVVNFQANDIFQLKSGSMKNVQNATTILLRHNEILLVEENLFGGRGEINYLDLAYNNIVHFGDGVLNGIKKLKTLSLAFNRITCFPGDWNKIFVAEETILVGNYIEDNCWFRFEQWKKRHPGHNITVYDPSFH